MDITDVLLPDLLDGLDDEDDNESELIQYFGQKMKKREAEAKIIGDEMDFVDEDLVESEEENIFLLNDPLAGLDEESSALTNINEQTALVERRAVLPFIDTLEAYTEMHQTELKHMKSYGQDDKTSAEITRRMMEYYEHYNDILPAVLLRKDFFQVCEKFFPGEQLEERYKLKPTLDKFIIVEIRNKRNILSLTTLLKEFFEKSFYVDNENNRFVLTSVNEAKVLNLLNKLTAFYGSELVSYERDLGTRDLSQVSIDQTVDKFLVLHQEQEFVSLSKVLAYPETIYLDNKTYVCGGCGSVEPYNHPFLHCVILNSTKNGFLRILPSMEMCSSCGFSNLLPANYFKTITDTIKKKFYESIHAESVNHSLNHLSNGFTRYTYNLPNHIIIESQFKDLKQLYQDRSVYTAEFTEATFTKTMNRSRDAATYKERITSLRAANGLLAAQKQTMKERTINPTANIDTNFRLNKKYVAKVYSSISQLYCTAVGTDYSLLKIKALNSLLFFLEDYIPFIVNPFAVMREYASHLAGLMDEDMYNAILSEHNVVKRCLDECADYLSFVPITVVSSTHRNLEQYMQDEFMKDYLDYITDAMIIFHLREDLIDVCVVGQAFPFLNTKVKLSNLLISSQKDPLISKFAKSLEPFKDVEIADFLSTKRHWLYNKCYNCVEHKTLFKAFLAKDIYDIMQIVFTNEKGYETIAKALEPLRTSFENKSKLEFYYGDIFEGEDFTKYLHDDIGLFYILPKEENENFQDYLNEIKNCGSRIKAGKIKCNDWLSNNVPAFFELLKDNILSKLSPSNVIFMDMMKSLTVFGAKVAAQAFSVSNSILDFASTGTKGFTLPSFDKEKEFAKQLLFIYPYTNSSLQLLIAECESDDINSVVNVLLSEPDLLIEEFSGSSDVVKEILRDQFDLYI